MEPNGNTKPTAGWSDQKEGRLFIDSLLGQSATPDSDLVYYPSIRTESRSQLEE
jgi:hypothetical protein